MSGGNCPRCHALLDEEKSPYPSHVRWVCREACGYTKDVYQPTSILSVTSGNETDRHLKPIMTPGLTGVDTETAMDFWSDHCETWGPSGCEARFRARKGVPVHSRRRATR